MGAVSSYEKHEPSAETDVFQQINYLNWHEGLQESSSKCSMGSSADLCSICFEIEEPNAASLDSGFLSWEDCLG